MPCNNVHALLGNKHTTTTTTMRRCCCCCCCFFTHVHSCCTCSCRERSNSVYHTYIYTHTHTHTHISSCILSSSGIQAKTHQNQPYPGCGDDATARSHVYITSLNSSSPPIKKVTMVLYLLTCLPTHSFTNVASGHSF